MYVINFSYVLPPIPQVVLVVPPVQYPQDPAGSNQPQSTPTQQQPHQFADVQQQPSDYHAQEVPHQSVDPMPANTQAYQHPEQCQLGPSHASDAAVPIPSTLPSTSQQPPVQYHQPASFFVNIATPMHGTPQQTSAQYQAGPGFVYGAGPMPVASNQQSAQYYQQAPIYISSAVQMPANSQQQSTQYQPGPSYVISAAPMHANPQQQSVTQQVSTAPSMPSTSHQQAVQHESASHITTRTVPIVRPPPLVIQPSTTTNNASTSKIDKSTQTDQEENANVTPVMVNIEDPPPESPHKDSSLESPLESPKPIDRESSTHNDANESANTSTQVVNGSAEASTQDANDSMKTSSHETSSQDDTSTDNDSIAYIPPAKSSHKEPPKDIGEASSTHDQAPKVNESNTASSHPKTHQFNVNAKAFVPTSWRRNTPQVVARSCTSFKTPQANGSIHASSYRNTTHSNGNASSSLKAPHANGSIHATSYRLTPHTNGNASTSLKTPQANGSIHASSHRYSPHASSSLVKSPRTVNGTYTAYPATESSNVYRPRFMMSQANIPDFAIYQQEMFERKFRGVLNRVDERNFDSIIKELNVTQLTTDKNVIKAIDLIFDKALSDERRAKVFAKLYEFTLRSSCIGINEKKRMAYSKHMENRFQSEKEKGVGFLLMMKKIQEIIVALKKVKRRKGEVQTPDDLAWIRGQIDYTRKILVAFGKRLGKNLVAPYAKDFAVEDLLSICDWQIREYEKLKHDFITRESAVVTFMSELFKLELFSLNSLKLCFKFLLGIRSQICEEKIFILCILLMKVGKHLDRRAPKQVIEIFIILKRIKDANQKNFSNRTKIALNYLDELRFHKWVHPRSCDNSSIEVQEKYFVMNCPDLLLKLEPIKEVLPDTPADLPALIPEANLFQDLLDGYNSDCTDIEPPPTPRKKVLLPRKDRNRAVKNVEATDMSDVE